MRAFHAPMSGLSSWTRIWGKGAAQHNPQVLSDHHGPSLVEDGDVRCAVQGGNF